jgi:hypothetical protein
MSDHLSDRDPRAFPRKDVRQHFEFLMLHPPELRKHVLKLRLLSTIGLLHLSPGRPSRKCHDFLLQCGPSVTEVSEEILRQVLYDDVTLLKLHELIWRGEAGSYWSRKIENELDAETWLELDPEVDARIKATVVASVREAFSEDPVAVSNQRVERATAGTSRSRAIARLSLEDYVDAGNGNNVVTLGEDNDMVYVGGWANTIMAGDGDDSIDAGKGDNLIVATLGRHIVQVVNGSNILIDGSVQLTQSGDSLRRRLDDWIAYGDQAANVADIRSRLLVTCNTHYANTLHAGSGLDWFWATDTWDNLNAKRTDLRN